MEHAYDSFRPGHSPGRAGPRRRNAATPFNHEARQRTSYVLKNIGKQELVNALEKIAGGGIYFSEEVIDELQRAGNRKKQKEEAHLTDREIEIIRLIEKEYNYWT